MDFNKYDGEPVYKEVMNLNQFYSKSTPSYNTKLYFSSIRKNLVFT